MLLLLLFIVVLGGRDGECNGRIVIGVDGGQIELDRIELDRIELDRRLQDRDGQIIGILGGQRGDLGLLGRLGNLLLGVGNLRRLVAGM